MDARVTEVVEELKAQGIGVCGDASEIYSLTAPNGEKYQFDAAGLLELKSKGKLHLDGLLEAHLAKKKIPNL